MLAPCTAWLLVCVPCVPRFVGVGARRVRALFHAAKKKVADFTGQHSAFLPRLSRAALSFLGSGGLTRILLTGPSAGMIVVMPTG